MSPQVVPTTLSDLKSTHDMFDLLNEVCQLYLEGQLNMDGVAYRITGSSCGTVYDIPPDLPENVQREAVSVMIEIAFEEYNPQPDSELKSINFAYRSMGTSTPTLPEDLHPYTPEKFKLRIKHLFSSGRRVRIY